MPLWMGGRRSLIRRRNEAHGVFAEKADPSVFNNRHEQRKAQLGASDPRVCGGRRGHEIIRVLGTMVCVLVLARFFTVVDIVVPIVNGRPRMIHGQVHKNAAGDHMPQHRGNEENNRGERAQGDEHPQTLPLGSKCCQASPPCKCSRGAQSLLSA